MTVSPAVGLAPTTQGLSRTLARGLVAPVAFGLLSGIWLAYFTFVPFDLRIR